MEKHLLILPAPPCTGPLLETAKIQPREEGGLERYTPWEGEAGDH